MRVVLLFLIFITYIFGFDLNLTTSLVAIDKIDKNDTNLSIIQPVELNTTNLIVDSFYKDIEVIDASIDGNIWLTQYQNYLSYKELVKERDFLQKKLNEAKKNDDNDTISDDIKVYDEQILLLSEYENAPFSKMFGSNEIPEYQKITTPFGIFQGISYIKQLKSSKDEHLTTLNSLISLVDELEEKREILHSISTYIPENKKVFEDILKLDSALSEFKSAKNLGKTTYDVYSKRIDERIIMVRVDIKTQIKRAINIGALIVFIFLLSLFFKYIVKKSVKDNERSYMASKFINFINFILILLIVLFAYIDNISYMVTLLGFASAGLAIAMKDMFMSMLGWAVIMIGGTYRVGDRIKARKANGEIYVGDIIDISLLRMTVYEDITMTTWRETRRAGRIVFVPNNYIFTELISNYSHSGMKTVWDGIDIMLTFDSNHKKAIYIIRNIVRQYSKGYTDIAKKQMNKLRTQYSIKSPSVEPRIYHFFEPYGIQISVWYMTNSYATLGLRSTISGEILEALQKENDIHIAYPTHTLQMRENTLFVDKSVEHTEHKIKDLKEESSKKEDIQDSEE